jgi:hypothetical protein
MSTTRAELESFHRFALGRLDSGASESLDELLVQWQDRNSRDEVNAAIRRGVADIGPGRYQPANVAMESIRQEFGFASRLPD